MRGLTVRQPWAWAIIHGGKDVENRSRNIAGSYRGPVAIHAGLVFDDEAWDSAAFNDAFWVADRKNGHMEAPRGAIIGVAVLLDVHTAGDCWDRDMRRLARLYREHPDEFAALPDDGSGGVIGRTRLCSTWAMGDYHLVLRNPRPLAQPIPWRGRLGLWTVPADFEAAIRAGVS